MTWYRATSGKDVNKAELTDLVTLKLEREKGILQNDFFWLKQIISLSSKINNLFLILYFDMGHLLVVSGL